MVLLWEDDSEWVKKCMEYEVEGVILKGLEKVVEADMKNL